MCFNKFNSVHLGKDAEYGINKIRVFEWIWFVFLLSKYKFALWKFYVRRNISPASNWNIVFIISITSDLDSQPVNLSDPSRLDFPFRVHKRRGKFEFPRIRSATWRGLKQESGRTRLAENPIRGSTSSFYGREGISELAISFFSSFFLFFKNEPADIPVVYTSRMFTSR